MTASRELAASADHGAELEDRQVHRDHEAADHHAQEDHDYWFEQLAEAGDGIVHLALEEVCDPAQHGVELAGLFADGNHLDHHRREDERILHGYGETGASADIRLDLLGGRFINHVAGCAADGVKRLDEGNAGAAPLVL